MEFTPQLIISSLTAFGTAVSMWLLARGDYRGWYLSLANQAWWVALALITGAYGLLPLNVWLTFVAFKGIRKFKRLHE